MIGSSVTIGSGSTAARSGSERSSGSTGPTETITMGVSPLAENRRARLRLERRVPSTRREHDGPARAGALEHGHRLTVGGAALVALAGPAVDRELGRVPRPGGTGGAGDVGARGDARALERHETPRHGAIHVLEHGADPVALVDGHGEQREIGGDVGKALGVDAPVQAEALDAAQQRRDGEPVAREAPHHGLARRARPGGHRFPEVHGQLEGVRDHASAPPTSRPSAVAARPATMETSR